MTLSTNEKQIKNIFYCTFYSKRLYFIFSGERKIRSCSFVLDIFEKSVFVGLTTWTLYFSRVQNHEKVRARFRL